MHSPEPETPAAVPPGSLAGDRELLSDFVLEANEHLAGIESLALALEREPGDGEAVRAMFRAFHSIKGLAGFLEMDAVREVAHEVETVLDAARRGALAMRPPVIDLVLQSADCLRIFTARTAAQLSGAEEPAAPAHAPLVERLRVLAAEAAAAPAPGVRRASPDSEPQAEEGRTPSFTVETRAVKVDTAKLDYLSDMAGEMVIAQSLVRFDPELAALQSPRLLRHLSQLSRITGEIQRTAMTMRLVPVASLFQRVVRLVHDLSRRLGKPAQVDVSGAGTELDRTLIEQLSDPLMHMVRNALDHGIETADERAAAGKPPVARIGLRASHQGGYVLIEVSDDGRGLNRDRILAKAQEKGLVNRDALLSDQEIYQLIFEPGFSTAAETTDISGRGVGMDIVLQHVQKLRGRAEMRSVTGQGATFVLKVPLTLAIIDGLVAGVGAERYIVPLFAVQETFQPAPGAVTAVLGRGEMVLVRDGLLPVARLGRRFGVRARSEDPRDGMLIVAQTENRRFCLLVDELIGKQEVVIKSLGETFQNIPGIAGGAILGDGRVGLVLDMDSLAKEHGAEAHDRVETHA